MLTVSSRVYRPAVAAGVGLAAVLLRRRWLASWARLFSARAREVARLDAAAPAHVAWLRRMECFVFDIDGVVHTGAGPIAGAAAAIAALRGAGKRVLFLTNNGTKSPQNVVDEFARMGLAAAPAEVTTSGALCAAFLAARGLRGRNVYVIGERALVDALAAPPASVRAFGGPDDAGKTKADLHAEGFSIASLDPPAAEVAAVVVAADGAANYYKIARAAAYLVGNRSCLFVVTNPDPAFTLAPAAGAAPPTLSPAAGVWARAVAMTSGREPDLVCGKPSASLARHMVERFELDPARTCMVGDRLDTDIEFGHNAGFATLMVESGTMKAEAAHAATGAKRPDFIAPSIATLGDLVAAAPVS